MSIESPGERRFLGILGDSPTDEDAIKREKLKRLEEEATNNMIQRETENGIEVYRFIPAHYEWVLLKNDNAAK